MSEEDEMSVLMSDMYAIRSADDEAVMRSWSSVVKRAGSLCIERRCENPSSTFECASDDEKPIAVRRLATSAPREIHMTRVRTPVGFDTTPSRPVLLFSSTLRQAMPCVCRSTLLVDRGDAGASTPPPGARRPAAPPRARKSSDSVFSKMARRGPSAVSQNSAIHDNGLPARTVCRRRISLASISLLASLDAQYCVDSSIFPFTSVSCARCEQIIAHLFAVDMFANAADCTAVGFLKSAPIPSDSIRSLYMRSTSSCDGIAGIVARFFMRPSSSVLSPKSTGVIMSCSRGAPVPAPRGSHTFRSFPATHSFAASLISLA
mmetsp:Transcript_11184/g.35523  ORF Transcript_11184/g.35523 Transcript_11184/m.35523 type:complete len:319 (+) Transcript_11184:2396-3352(+)